MKKYGTSKSLITELRSIISDPKKPNDWLEIREDEYGWYVTKIAFLEKKVTYGVLLMKLKDSLETSFNAKKSTALLMFEC